MRVSRRQCEKFGLTLIAFGGATTDDTDAKSESRSVLAKISEQKEKLREREGVCIKAKVRVLQLNFTIRYFMQISLIFYGAQVRYCSRIGLFRNQKAVQVLCFLCFKDIIKQMLP